MKSTKTLLTLLAGVALSTAAYAQVEVTITGSTAFRSITIDRSASLFDPGSLTAITNDTAAPNFITFNGTVSNKVSSLHNTPVKIRLSFSGSGAGMTAVKNQTSISTAEAQGTFTTRVPDLALSDVFPAAASPPISEAAFDRDVLGVVPFVYARNNALTGISNITREQALLLMTASGVIGGNPGMPASYLGGSSGNPIYLIGRDSGSGSRISVERDIGFFNITPVLWATNGAGVYVQTNGYSSGGLVRNVIKGKSDAIGYLGVGDFVLIQGFATALSFNGVPYSAANVQNGGYGLWGYEHIVNRVGGLSPNQVLIRDALKAAITDQAFQTGNALYVGNFVDLLNMHVSRGADGGIISSEDF